MLNWHDDPVPEVLFYARAYWRAAKTLAEHMPLDCGPQSDFDASPVIFLYRHAAELYMKGLILGPGKKLLPDPPNEKEVCKDHSIRRLLPTLREVLIALDWTVDSDFGGFKSINDIEAALKDLDELDPVSFAFRYPITKDMRSSVPNQFQFSAAAFCKEMDAVCEAFECVRTGLYHKWGYMPQSGLIDDREFL